MDPEKTDTRNDWSDRYRRAEAKFDPLWIAIGSSGWTLAAFVLWTVVCVVFGFWSGSSP